MLACGLQVGRCMVFDDALEHSASYPSSAGTMSLRTEGVTASAARGDPTIEVSGVSAPGNGSSTGQPGGCAEIRAVLIIDLWHPGLTGLERRAVRHVFPPPAST
jgi:hypothetical protein